MCNLVLDEILADICIRVHDLSDLSDLHIIFCIAHLHNCVDIYSQIQKTLLSI